LEVVTVTQRGSNKIVNLALHTEKYVTVAQLAAYWQVSPKQIYKQIDAGTLPALRLGPRLYRIRTTAALDFERAAQMMPPDRADASKTSKK
jgi:excisionase family DNA binding protein